MSQDSYETILKACLHSLAQNQSMYTTLVSALEKWAEAETAKLNQMATATLLNDTSKPLALMQMGKVQALQDAVTFARHNMI